MSSLELLVAVATLAVTVAFSVGAAFSLGSSFAMVPSFAAMPGVDLAQLRIIGVGAALLLTATVTGVVTIRAVSS